MSDPKPCPQCDDGDGHCVFPYYGMGPHKHHLTKADRNAWIGSTIELPQSEWPDNYCEDAEVPGLGTYTHCPHCGCGA
jgi:hypothetical protein